MDNTRLSILDHLEEMRSRLLQSIICIAILFPLCYLFCDDTINWFLVTFCPEVQEVQTLQVMELFFTQMKVSAILALVGSYPFIAWQVWRFVAPGLYEHERYYASRFVVISTLLFVLGASIALFIVFPAVLRFGLGLASGKIVARPQLRGVINMAAMLMLGFGAMFQLPIVVYLLAITGLVSVDTMRKARPVAVVIIFIIAAMVTPGPDIISQCALALPSMLLFEISLLVSERAIRRKKRRKELEDRERPPPAASTAGGAPPPPAPIAPTPPAATASTVITPIPDGPMPDAARTQPAAGLAGKSARPGPTEEIGERWYEGVQDDAEPPPSPPAPVAPAPSALVTKDGDPYADGPTGSGLV